MSALITASQAVGEALKVVTGLPAFLAGSSVTSMHYADTVGEFAYSDVDIFCSSQNSLIASTQRFLTEGWSLNERYSRVWTRWLEFGFNKWHTNSVKLEKDGIEVNCIYKLVDGHPTTSLSQVLESFDFGFLAIGIDARDEVIRDMRSFFFPDDPYAGALPLLPLRRNSWRNGFISQYQGLREIGRYAKYHDYGYDLSLVKDDLITGYVMASNYLIDRGDEDKTMLGSIYQSLAMAMEDDRIDYLREAGAEILYLDDLDQIMEKLE